MTAIIVTTREGERIELDGEDGASIMEALREGDVDEVLAICGGCMSCATCQVYIDASDFHRLPPMSAEESALLDDSGVRQATSRLSCQIILDHGLDGIRLTVAPEP